MMITLVDVAFLRGDLPVFLIPPGGLLVLPFIEGT
jgi:hypothetical protein